MSDELRVNVGLMKRLLTVIKKFWPFFANYQNFFILKRRFCLLVEDISKVPPHSNRGVLNTYLVDWVTVSFVDGVDFDELCDLLKIEKTDWVEKERGLYGYRGQKAFKQTKFLFGGSESMGVCLELSGQGCRQLESRYQHNEGFDLWYMILWTLQHMGGKLSRLDLVVDDLHGYINLRRVISKVKKGECSSLFRSAQRVEKLAIDDGKNLGDTIYFGSPSSDIRIRIYDKAKQLELEGMHWVRVELQLRDDRANMAVIQLFNHSFYGTVFTGIIRNYLNFKDLQSGDSNKARWPVSKWWIDFLDNADRLRLTKAKEDKDFQQVEDWVFKQVAPSLAMIYEGYREIGCTEEEAYKKSNDKLQEFIKNGRVRMSDNHYMMLHKKRENLLRSPR